jgi:oxygen-independent coproporphyrinogen-3 oxidase
MGIGSSARDLGVYVHLPFCERVCPYCDFAVEGVGLLDQARAAGYVDVVLRELEAVCSRLERQLAGRRLATLYLGGGTPSLWPARELERLIAAIRGTWDGVPEEVTLELNPGQRELAQVEALRASGVTRVSVGVQSFDDEVLKRLGRAHAGADARRGLDAVLAAGFTSVSADLIYGAPGQASAGVERDVAELVERGVPHVSTYALTLEPGTPFASAHTQGRLALPDEDVVAGMADGIGAALERAGHERYEISSYARPGHRARHNQRYWQRLDVLGLGVSAASLIEGRRLQNPRDRAAYASAVVAGKPAWDHDVLLTDEAARREALYLGFRRIEGISVSGYAARYGAAPDVLFGAELRALRERGLIETRGDALLLTSLGLRFADEVFLALVEDA